MRTSLFGMKPGGSALIVLLLGAALAPVCQAQSGTAPAASFPGLVSTLVPADPVAGEPVWIRLKGYWSNGCTPPTPSVFRSDGQITIRFLLPNTPCPAVIRPVDMKIFLGNFPKGDYAIQIVLEVDGSPYPPQAHALDKFVVAPPMDSQLPSSEISLSPAAPSPRDSITLTLNGLWPDSCIPSHGHVSREGSAITVTVSPSGQVCKDAITLWNLMVPLGSLPEGIYTLNVVPELPGEKPAQASPFRFVVLDQTSASEATLQNGRYLVTCRWKSQFDSAVEGTLKGYSLAATTAAFWYFDVDKTEVFVRLLTPADGANNGKTWVAITALTDVEFWVFVLDRQTMQNREYHSPAGSGRLIVDTSTFNY